MSNKAYKNMQRIFKAYINEHIFEMIDKWHGAQIQHSEEHSHCGIIQHFTEHPSLTESRSYIHQCNVTSSQNHSMWMQAK